MILVDKLLFLHVSSIPWVCTIIWSDNSTNGIGILRLGDAPPAHESLGEI